MAPSAFSLDFWHPWLWLEIVLLVVFSWIEEYQNSRGTRRNELPSKRGIEPDRTLLRRGLARSRGSFIGCDRVLGLVEDLNRVTSLVTCKTSLARRPSRASLMSPPIFRADAYKATRVPSPPLSI